MYDPPGLWGLQITQQIVYRLSMIGLTSPFYSRNSCLEPFLTLTFANNNQDNADSLQNIFISEDWRVFHT